MDLLTISGHKIGAMKGSVPSISARAFGRFPDPGRTGAGLRRYGGHPQIAALAAAASLGRERMEEHTAALTDLKAMPWRPSSGGARPGGGLPRGRAPHLRHLPAGVSQPVVVRWLSDRGFCVSSGSACHRGRPAMSMPPCTCPKGCGTGCCGYPSPREHPAGGGPAGPGLLEATRDLVPARG
ncbi:MAG: hypothetical protein ACLS43_01725 [Evtepia gabavorous]